MGDGIEVEPGLLVGEGHGGQGLAVDGPVGGDDAGPEAVDQRLVGRTAGRHDVAGHLVGVDEHGAPADQQVGHGRLARADATGEADGQHQLGGAVPAASDGAGGARADGEEDERRVVEVLGDEPVVGGDARERRRRRLARTSL